MQSTSLESRLATRGIDHLAPLAPQQLGMMLDALAAGSARHLEQIAFTAQELDVATFREAWQALVARHPMLRTAFVWPPSRSSPIQVVLAHAEIPLVFEDYQGLAADDQRVRLEAAQRAQREQAFNLAEAPLLRVHVARLDDCRHRVVVTFHHLLLDGWSVAVMFAELWSLYAGQSPGPAARPYRDYVAWLERQDVAGARRFWQQCLADFPGATPPGTLVEGEYTGAASGSVTASTPLGPVRELAGRWQVTLSSLVQAAWAAVLAGWSGSTDVIFGVTISGRPPELDGYERMLGLFLNTVPLRLGVRPEARFATFAAQAQTAGLDLQDVAFASAGQVHGWSGVPAGQPLYYSVVVFENYPFGSTAGPATVRLSELDSWGARTAYPLVLMVVPTHALDLRLVYDGRRLSAADAQRVLVQLVSTLEGVAAEPDIRMGALLDRIRATHPARFLVPARPTVAEAPTTAAGNALLESVSALWSEVLGADGASGGGTFFEQGGHSLLAATLITRLRETFQVDLPLTTLLEHPTLPRLADAVARARQTGSPPLQLPSLAPDAEHRYEPFPLTPVQQAYWIGRTANFELGNVSVHGYLELDVAELDPQRFTRAWQRLIERHEMLRAIITPDGQQQILREVPPFQPAVLDLTTADASAASARLAAVRAELSHQVLPSDTWPLFDIRLSRLGDGRTRIHYSFDALIADAWSFQVLDREFALFYADPEAQLAPIDVSFRDYVTAVEGLRHSDAGKRDAAYWKSRVGSLPPAPELPLACNPRTVSDPHFVRRERALAVDAWRALKQRAAASGVSPSGVLLTAFAEVLATWSRRACFTLCLTTFQRLPLHPQVNAVVGDFTSLTLLEIDDAGGTFEERARRLQQRLWTDQDHGLVSGVDVLRDLARQHQAGSPGDKPGAVVPVVFTSTLVHATSSEQPGPLDGEPVFSVGQTPQVWLDCQVFEREGALHYTWDTVDALFPAGVVDDMLEAFGSVLNRLLEPDMWQTRLTHSLVPPAHTRRRRAWQETAPAPATSLHATFFARPEVDKTAVRADDGSLTYAELAGLALRLAGRLRGAGLERSDAVAIVLPRGLHQVVAVLGVLAAGGVYVPIDPADPAVRVRELLRRCGCSMAVTSVSLEAQLDWPPSVRVLHAEDGTGGSPEPSPVALMPPDALGYIIFTSGSTGVPKGVMIEHGSALNTIADVNRRIGLGTHADDRVLALSALTFDLSVWDIFGTLGAGATIVMPAAHLARDPAHWADLLLRERVTVWNSTPALMQLLVEYLEGSDRLPPGGTALRAVMLSGDWIPVNLPDRIRRLFGDIDVLSLGGATEAAIWSIFYPVQRVDPTWASIPYGRPLANQRTYVLNEHLQFCPDAVTGEIYIAGAGLARGYVGDEQQTRERFLIHPATGERLYRTGDLGRYRPDGQIELLGRVDEQVKIQGFRVELGEIEATLAQHEDLESSAVVASGDVVRGRSLVAFVVPRGGAGTSPRDWQRFLSQHLPAHLVPSVIHPVPALPLTPNGKLDRVALVRQAAQQSPSTPQPNPQTSVQSAAAAGRLGAVLAAVDEVMGLGQVAPDRGLLDLGATSVDMIRVANALERRTGCRPSLDALYRNTSLTAVAESLQEPTPPLPPGLLLDPHEREVFHARRLGRRSDRPPGALALPQHTPERRARRSHRQFRLNPIPVAQFGDWLAALQAVSTEGEDTYHYASAGSTYAVQCYLHVKPGRVEGLGGFYYYHPPQHQLWPLADGPSSLAAVYDPLLNRPVYDECAFGVFLVARLSAIQPLYAARALHYATIEAGAIAHLLETRAANYGLGLCQIGEVAFDQIRGSLQLQDTDQLVHSLLGGVVDERPPAEVQATDRFSRLEARVDQLSDNEVAALLAARRGTRSEERGSA